ncbi:sensor histidine kinase [Solwaraspora sp. WMMB335]|uniref:sensor histidine kinase n=1 Tax=Solwaraspora sp. WMMB335 TaxID=3404118 RepID=UPI003B92FBC0
MANPGTLPPVDGWQRLTGTLTARTVGVVCAVAVLSVLVTASVAIPLGVRSTERGARQALAGKADVAAAALATAEQAGQPVGQRAALADRLVDELAAQGLQVYLVRPGDPAPAGLPEPVVRRLAAGQSVSRRPVLLDGRPALLEGRPAGGGSVLVLVQPLRTGTGRIVWGNLWLALAAGLAAGLLAGVLLAARLSRPIRAAADAAVRLRAGERTVRVPVEPPIEAAQLARALNDLAAALATSEARQREFLLSISHELRTPLTTLSGYAEAIADGVVDPATAPDTGRLMLGEARRLDRLVSDLLALARLEASEFSLDPVEVDLVALVGDAAAAWRPRFAAEAVTLEAATPRRSLPIRTDPGRLRQVIDILLDNALRVVPAGGTVRLAVSPPGRDPVSTPPQDADGDMVALQVSDNGPGFADDDLAVVFERGALHRRYRGERSVGTGIGLALAAGLVRRLGGRISAGHALGGGAAFTVWLPPVP